MKMTSRLFALLACCGVSAYALAEPAIDYRTEKPEQKAKIDMALEVLKHHCHPLFTVYADDIESIVGYEYADSWLKKSGERACASFRCDQYGWKSSINIQVKLKDNPSKIPTRYRAFGHTEYFFVGLEPNPGYTVTKFPILCGVDQSPDGSDTFVPTH